MLRRLVALERQELADELAGLRRQIAELQRILASERRRRTLVAAELAQLAEREGHAPPDERDRRGRGAPPHRRHRAAAPWSWATTPACSPCRAAGCWAGRRTTPLGGRAGAAGRREAAGHGPWPARPPRRARRASCTPRTSSTCGRSPTGAGCSASPPPRCRRWSAAAAARRSPSCSRSSPGEAVVGTARSRRRGAAGRQPAGRGQAARRRGARPLRDGAALIALDEADRLVAAFRAPEDGDVVIVASDAQALRTAVGRHPRAGTGRPGRGRHEAAGRARGVVAAGSATEEGVVVTVSEGDGLKVTACADVPRQGRATGGVRLTRLRPEDGTRPSGGRSRRSPSCGAWWARRTTRPRPTPSPRPLPAAPTRRDATVGPHRPAGAGRRQGEVVSEDQWPPRDDDPAPARRARLRRRLHPDARRARGRPQAARHVHRRHRRGRPGPPAVGADRQRRRRGGRRPRPPHRGRLPRRRLLRGGRRRPRASPSSGTPRRRSAPSRSSSPSCTPAASSAAAPTPRPAACTAWAPRSSTPCPGRLVAEVERDGVRWRLTFVDRQAGRFEGRPLRPHPRARAGGEGARRPQTGTRVRFWPDRRPLRSRGPHRRRARAGPRRADVLPRARPRDHPARPARPARSGRARDVRAPPGACPTTSSTSRWASRSPTSILAQRRGHLRGERSRRRPHAARSPATCRVEAAFRWVKGYDTTLVSFVNTIPTPEGGTHVAGFERAFTYVVNDVLAAGEAKKLEALQGRGPGQPRRRPGRPGGRAQGHLPRAAVPGPDQAGAGHARGAARSSTTWSRPAWPSGSSGGKRTQVDAVRAKITTGIEVRLTQRHQRETLRRASALGSSGMPAKLADCRSTDVDDSELLIVEGDSAAGPGQGRAATARSRPCCRSGARSSTPASRR